MFASYFVSPKDLWTLIGRARVSTILDVRRREVYDAARGSIPTAQLVRKGGVRER